MQYSSRVDEFKVDRTKKKYALEILADGKIWGDVFAITGKQHFSFGIRKAKMILGAMDIIEKFIESNGREPLSDSTIKIENEKHGEPLHCLKENGFDYYDKTIEKPYLVLESLNNLTSKISFGIEKAKAIVDLEEQIKEFVDKYKVKTKEE